MQKALNFNDVAIISVKGSDYRIHFWYMSKNDPINTVRNSDLKKVDHYKFFLLYVKMSETTYYRRNRATILNKGKEYYNDNNEIFIEKARNKYRELSEKEKNINREYGRNGYHNMSEEKKQRLK